MDATHEHATAYHGPAGLLLRHDEAVKMLDLLNLYPRAETAELHVRIQRWLEDYPRGSD